jgi:hypothetical protein
MLPRTAQQSPTTMCSDACTRQGAVSGSGGLRSATSRHGHTAPELRQGLKCGVTGPPWGRRRPGVSFRLNTGPPTDRPPPSTPLRFPQPARSGWRRSREGSAAGRSRRDAKRPSRDRGSWHADGVGRASPIPRACRRGSRIPRACPGSVLSPVVQNAARAAAEGADPAWSLASQR